MPRRKKAPNRKPSRHLQQLEVRSLLAIDVALAAGQLSIHGTEFDDTARVDFDPTGNWLDVTAGDQTLRFARADVERVYFEGLRGDDTFVNTTNLPSVALGGAGDDVLKGGSGADRLEGGAGSDRLEGGNERDSLDGGSGNDLLFGERDGDWLHGGEGYDHLYGGSGADLLSGGAEKDALVGGPDADTLFDDSTIEWASWLSAEDSATLGPAGEIEPVPDEVGGEEPDTTALPIPGGDLRPPRMYYQPGAAGGDGILLTEPYQGQATAQVNAGELVIYATYPGKTIRVRESAWQVTVVETAEDSDTTIHTIHVAPLSSVQSIRFEGGAGDDEFHNETTLPSVIKGGAGNDRLYGGISGDVVLGGAGDDYLSGGDGVDVLDGGEGADGLEGGSGADFLNGGLQADRFLVRAGDVMETISQVDVVVQFTDTSTGIWKDQEIEAVDRAFELLQTRTGNTYFLKDTLTSKPINFERHDIAIENGEPKPSYLGTNFEPTSPRLIHLYNAAFNTTKFGEDVTAGTTIHELAHNWDSAKEIGRALSEYEWTWDAFANINTEAMAGGKENFVGSYAYEGGIKEDFSETLAALVQDVQTSNSFIMERYKLLNSLLDGVKAKQPDYVWRGTYEPAYWEQLQDFFRQLDPSQWKFAMPAMSDDFLGNVLQGFSTDDLQRLIPHFDTGELVRFTSVLTTQRAADVLSAVDAETLTAAIGQMTDARDAEVLAQASWDAIAEVMPRLSGDRAAAILSRFSDNILKGTLKRVGWDTVMTAVNTLNAQAAAKLLERFDGEHFMGVMDRWSDGRIADVLAKASWGTVVWTFERFSDRDAAKVLARFDRDVLKGTLRRLDADKVAGMLDRLDGKDLQRALEEMTAEQIREALAHADKALKNAVKGLGGVADKVGKGAKKLDPRSWS